MPVYQPPLLTIDAKETRRYAGLMRAKDFSEGLITEACQDARLLAEPRGSYVVYDYDCLAQRVAADPPFIIEGKKIGQHLAGCDKVIILAATVGDGIESEVTQRFKDGHYAESVLLDAAATTAVEQIGDGMEHMLVPKAAAAGYQMRWRFSPGYGDWPLEQQPELIRLSEAAKIGVSLSSSLMLVPRKSITAIIGLYRTTTDTAAQKHTPNGCAACTNMNCPSRKAPPPDTSQN